VIESSAGNVSTLVDGDGSDGVTLVLGHGAGAAMDHPFMEHVAQGLARRGHRVVRFNFPYMQAGRKAPDRAETLEACFRAVADAVAGDGPLVLGGKSMGGRIASQVAAGGSPCDGLVFLGYPLHPPGKPERLRDAHLREIRVPMLFVEGTRDPFCPLETLDRVKERFVAPTTIRVIEDGDHSFRVRKSSGRDTYAAWNEVVEVTAGWLHDLS
jgi:uncharacterized protein